MNRGELAQLQSMPLKYAVERSIRKINTAYDKFDGNLVISKSGFDSQIVSKLCEMAGLDLPAISISRLEPKGNNTLNYSQGNIEFLPVPIDKKEIIYKWGYPLLTKENSMSISRYVLTKDPEVKYFQDEKAVCNATLAINNGKENTCFIDLVMWNNCAKMASQYTKKGSQVAIAGKLDQQKWQAKDGANRSKIVIVVNTIQFLDKKSKDDGIGLNQDPFP